MKIECECLIDKNTGKPLEIEFPDGHDMDALRKFRIAAWEAGRRFRMGFDLMTEEDIIKDV